MSCYLRHLEDVFAEAGITVTAENRKAIDQVLHQIVGVEYKHCPDAWKAIKEEIRTDPKRRARFVAKVKNLSKRS